MEVPGVRRRGEQIWLKAVRAKKVPVTRITHHAAMRLGRQQGITKTYRVDLRRDSMRPEHSLWVDGVESLERTDCGTRARANQLERQGRQPDVAIGWRDWERMTKFVSSRWAIPVVPDGGKPLPATRWHMYSNRRVNVLARSTRT
jgi:hypothetical protein